MKFWRMMWFSLSRWCFLLIIPNCKYNHWTLKNMFSFYFRSYTEPTIEGWRLEAAAAAFVEAVLGILKCKSVRVSFNTCISIDHDIVRYIFKNKGSIAPDGFNLYTKEDFSRFCLPPFWYYYFDELGEGVSVDFPVKLKTKLGFHSKRFIVNNFGSIKKGPLIPSEKVSVVIIRKACSKNTIT